MPIIKRLSQLEKLLPSGKRIERAAQEAAEVAQRPWKPGEFSRVVTPPRVTSVDPAFARHHLEQVQNEARLNPTEENLKRLKEVELDLLGVLEYRPLSEEAQAAEKRLMDFVGSDKKKPRILTQKQMREKREMDKINQEIDAAKEQADKTQIMPSELAKKAAAIAALTGGGLAASSLIPEEAEASPLSAAKKGALELFHATRGAFSGEKLKPGADKLIHFGTKEQAADRFAELAKTGKTSPGAQTIPLLADIKNPLELSDLSDWSANKIFRDMKKRGVIDEKQAQEIIDRSRATGKEIGNDINKDVLLEYIQKDLGHDAIKYKNIFEAAEADKIAAAAKINPDMAKIPELRSQKAELESQLLDASGKAKPSSRETDKIHDQINKIDKQLRPLQNKLQSTFEQGAEYSYAVPESHGGILKSRISGKPLAIGGAAIGAGALATSPSAQASEGPTVSRSNPEFASDAVEPKSKDLLSHFEQKYGTYDIPGGVKKLVETVDKYTGRPARAAALAALEGKNPLTGAVESVSKDQDVEGRQVARQFLENLEESGFKTRPPVDPRLEQLRQLGVEIEGKKPEEYLPSNEFPAEAPLGFAADMALDPTNLAGMGLGTKVGKGFSKIRNLVK